MNKVRQDEEEHTSQQRFAENEWEFCQGSYAGSSEAPGSCPSWVPRAVLMTQGVDGMLVSANFGQHILGCIEADFATKY